MSDREILIWLHGLGISNANIGKIINEINQISDFENIDFKKLESLNCLNEEIKEKITYKQYSEYMIQLYDKICEKNIKIITVLDEEYPKYLKNIQDKPMVLYIKGQIKTEDQISLAIVGSRKSTYYGKWACEKFVKELSEIGVTIISGLALGIDTIAHRIALDSGTRTIAVLGNGIDDIYPKNNKKLSEDIEKNGAVISEFPLGTPPLPYNFPRRNRIISGMSLGTIVIEAQEKSGSLITAYHALDQGKSVFAVPGNINSLFSSGTNRLIKDGAIPLLTIDDILEDIYQLKNLISKKQQVKIDYSNFSDIELKTIKLIEEGPLHFDLIAYKLNIGASNLSSIITILELKGVIKEISSRIFTVI